ncbi:hypothetical protein [Martelella sp. HB161492]|uniref:hypothetical protein n=1 Tax=Martelella sp. HB161492 TaxID=2720726 RepID=UPI0015901DFA|nr:hypothetical protein [Martelella sp. HB161492]
MTNNNISGTRHTPSKAQIDDRAPVNTKSQRSELFRPRVPNVNRQNLTPLDPSTRDSLGQYFRRGPVGDLKLSKSDTLLRDAETRFETLCRAFTESPDSEKPNMIEQDLASATWDLTRAAKSTKPLQQVLSSIRNIESPTISASAFDKAALHWAAADRMPSLSPTQSENHYTRFVDAASGTPADKLTRQLNSVVELFGHTKLQPIKLKQAIDTLLTMHDSIRDNKSNSGQAADFSAGFIRRLAETICVVEPNARANVREKNIAQVDTLQKLIPRLPAITKIDGNEMAFDAYRAVAKSLSEYARRRGSSPDKAQELNKALQKRCDACSPEAANMLRFASPTPCERPLHVFTAAGREWSYPALGPNFSGSEPGRIQIAITGQD